MAFPVTRESVGSYPAFPPLPSRRETAVYLCCTILGVASTGRYPASCPVKPGLSSPAAFRHMQLRLPVLLAVLDCITKSKNNQSGTPHFSFWYTLKVNLGRSLFSFYYVLNQLFSIRRGCCQLIAALILRMAVVPFDPDKGHLMGLFGFQKTFPEIDIFDRFVFPSFPAFLDPSLDPILIKGVYQILGIGIEIYLSGPI